MFGTSSWITSIFGSGSIAGAFISIAFDIYNKQMPSSAELAVLGSALSAGVGLIQAKDKNVTGGTISAATGATTAKPVSLIDAK